MHPRSHSRSTYPAGKSADKDILRWFGQNARQCKKKFKKFVTKKNRQFNKRVEL
jgi:hypothetical protein